MDAVPVEAHRSCFLAAAGGFTAIVDQVPPSGWDRVALGGWGVRDLVGHTSRALSPIEAYLTASATKAPEGGNLDGPVSYFLAVRASLADPEAVAQRGRDAGAALGPNPAAAVHELVERASALVHQTPDDATLATPVGTMTLAHYLPTRTFELVVHSLDLTRVLGVRPPTDMVPAIATSLELAGALGSHLSTAPDLLLLLTGRTGLPEHLSVI